MAIHSPRSATKPMAPGKPAAKAASSMASSTGGRTKVASQPPPAISGFPESLPIMPVVDVAVFDQPLEMPEVASVEAVVMPIAPSMPKVDWDSLLRPVDLSAYGGLTIEAAVQAVRAVENRPPSRKRPVPQQTSAAPKGTAAASQPQPSSKPKRKSKLIYWLPQGVLSTARSSPAGSWRFPTIPGCSLPQAQPMRWRRSS